MIASGADPNLAVSEHDSCFVGGAVTLDDVSFTVAIAYISRATLDSERQWTPLRSGTGSNISDPNGAEAALRNQFQHTLGSQSTGEHWQGRDHQCTSLTVA